MCLLQSCGTHTGNQIKSSDVDTSVRVLAAGKYELEAQIPVFVKIDLKYPKIPPSNSIIKAKMLLDRKEDGTTTLSVCRYLGIDSKALKLSYEPPIVQYNKEFSAIDPDSFLIEIDSIKAKAVYYGSTVYLDSNQKLTLDLDFFKNDDGGYSIRGNSGTKLWYSDIKVKLPFLKKARIRAFSSMEKDMSKHRYFLKEIDPKSNCSDL